MLFEDQKMTQSGQSTNRPQEVSKGASKGANIGQNPEDQKGDISKRKRGKRGSYGAKRTKNNSKR